jgi:hypothetical protein
MQSIQIITNEIESRVLNDIEKEYDKIKSRISEKIDNLTNMFMKQYNDYNELLEKSMSKLDTMFDNFITNSGDNNKLSIMISIKDFINLLKKIESDKTSKKIKLNDIIGNMEKLCEKVPHTLSNITNIKNGDASMELYEKIINTNSITINRPLIGKIVITMNDIEKTLNKKSTDLYTLIDDIITNFDFTPFNIRSENMSKSCEDELNRLRELKDNNESKNMMIDHMYEYVLKIVDIIQSSNLRKNNDLVEFVDLLDSVLGIQVEIEVMEPDTYNDDLYAKILDICVVNPRDPLSNKNNLIEIGINLGFSVEELWNLTDLQLCDKYNTFFRY